MCPSIPLQILTQHGSRFLKLGLVEDEDRTQEITNTTPPNRIVPPPNPSTETTSSISLRTGNLAARSRAARAPLPDPLPLLPELDPGDAVRARHLVPVAVLLALPALNDGARGGGPRGELPAIATVDLGEAVQAALGRGLGRGEGEGPAARRACDAHPRHRGCVSRGLALWGEVCLRVGVFFFFFFF